ncbi:MBL fold metallo-hydrolase [Halobacillus andaensis]|uniref:MBL fold metallo-hydrolase n=1 Tax=Halobacillus andaensis TaxID=1176239 RepID=A0A917BAL5_HALAA|nr:MBL fold metallo-hydrolase [Halobacillus andaensis]MBP2006377.1 glyoxylase-like metal-dependent hydrolase (beta-lactamase superfamily II) [Halobacillus andaensis]GGF34692.1 MBL fold metallo-hydrolase [Halobacillus andaensis]
MKKKDPIKFSDRIHLIDGFDLGIPGRTGTYVIEEENLTLVETGPSPSVPRIVEGLKDLELDPKDVRYLILTHIHLDHAGGAGLLLKECPEAEVIVHEKGKRHLANPSRLIEGARAVYGDSFDQLFDPILPIEEEKLIVKEEGDTLEISPDCTLKFFDTPGHANHHLGIYDPVSNGIFTGDTAGIRYHQTLDYGVTFYLPSTSPNQFDPEEMKQSIQRFRDLKVDHIYFGHFGKTDEPEAAFNQVVEWIPKFVEAGEEALVNGNGIEGVKNRLYEKVNAYLRELQIPDDHPVYEVIQLDIEVCAMGLVDYLRKKERNR